MRLPHVRPGWVVFGAALVLRTVWIACRWHAAGAELDYPDETLHWELAHHLVQEGTLVSADGRYAARMPVYPLFLAYFAGFGTAGVLLARLGQAVIGALTAVVGARLATSAFTPRIGLLAGLLIACDPFQVFFANLLLTEVVFAFFAVSLANCAWAYLRGRRTGWALAGLCVLGPACILTRPSAAGWIPLLWVLIGLCAVDRRRTTLHLLLAPAVLALLMLPWGLRNQARLGDPAWLSTNGGVTLYDAQGPQADGSSDQAFLKDTPGLAGLGEVERDRRLKALALAQMRQDPFRVLRLAWVKLVRTWSPTPNVAEWRGGPAAAAGAAYTVGVLAAAAIGLLRAALRRLRPHQFTFWRLAPGARTFHALLWLPVVYFTFVHCIYIGSVRYRVPLMPFVELAAVTAVAAPSAMRR